MRLTLLSFLLTGCGTNRERGTNPDTVEDDTGIAVDDSSVDEAASVRLTPTEYNNTVRDLFGFTEEWTNDEDEDDRFWPYTFPEDIKVHGFEGMVEGQVSSPYLIEQYRDAATHFAPFARSGDYFWSCDINGLSGEEAEACVWQSIERLAQRAWRRPFLDGEQERLKAFHDQNVRDWGIDDGITLTVQGLLLSPGFLYRINDATRLLGADEERIALTGWEIASRMSYFLWDSMPDAALFEAAAQGQLRDPEQIEEHARRMLADPRAQEAVVHFHRQWLALENIYTATPDLDTYVPIYGGDINDIIAELEEEEPNAGLIHEEREELWSSQLVGLRRAMQIEAELFIRDTLFERSGTLEELFTSNQGYVSTLQNGSRISTADLYDVDDSAIDYSQTRYYNFWDGNFDYDLVVNPATMPANQRAGVLTLGGVLMGKSHPVHPAPILRGVFVLENFACVSLGQPPDSAAGTAPPDTLVADGTNRERTEAITSSPECAACHDRINPVGFALEHFDSMGGWRVEDNNKPVDASGVLRLSQGEEIAFSGPVELAAGLSQSRQVYDCYALNWTRYALGVEPSEQALQPVQRAFYESGGDVQQLLIEILKSDLFRYRSAQ